MISRNYSPKNGQSLVEMALLLPVLLLITVVTLDLGRAIYYYSAVYNAAREGARAGIIDPIDYYAINVAAEQLTVGLDQSRLDIIACECGSVDEHKCDGENTCPTGYTDIIRVKVSYDFELITPLANIFTGNNSILLSSVSYMAIER